ncbi:imidazoleglycerol-phosphate dehydratase [Ignicoccus hospitalis]|uniref:Imidazoleglycerol-phosphate dehydratase n=1 Tax=Ignicoccus hospitalis (strain KIN4/I / DSM 18386 / JCM 14125) TaxID=453591 RepID=A8AAN5_IGNH4|nr:imidazoleglycerol-phosphate dehydratase [Ignicoccus hospitalis]ABU81987.1 imidazoleglycerol-phosphate dehydratase [Ignicoccus hospitalis KIN4/I]HIH89854.1 imidazoleglycerol-phosphate dehydratase [Desulfurococcaceae archaeon]
MERRTKETVVKVEKCERASADVEIPFFRHMLETFLKHSGLAACISARDLQGFDDHHLVEDVAIVLGRFLKEEFAKKVEEGTLKRFTWSLVPMDEALARCALDVSGRGGFYGSMEFEREEIGGLALENVEHFFETLAREARITLHLDLLKGKNDHHKVEALFKAFAKCVSEALGYGGELSTKGVIEINGQ